MRIPEIVGMLPEGNWITCAPSLCRKAALLAKVQDGAATGFILCRGGTLGTSREELVDLMLAGKAKYSSSSTIRCSLGGHRRGSAGWSMAPIMNQIPLCRCSTVLTRDDPRLQEVLSSALGFEIMLTLARGSEQRRWSRTRSIAGGGRC
jgi:ring-1,2-phenylacetyl-CoA epoxidase subunit PaaA